MLHIGSVCCSSVFTNNAYMCEQKKKACPMRSRRFAWHFISKGGLVKLKLSVMALNPNPGLSASSADGAHDVSGPCGPACPGTDKPTKSCKQSFSWEDMSRRYIYFSRHLRKHKWPFLIFCQTTRQSVFLFCDTCACEPVWASCLTFM